MTIILTIKRDSHNEEYTRIYNLAEKKNTRKALLRGYFLKKFRKYPLFALWRKNIERSRRYDR